MDDDVKKKIMVGVVALCVVSAVVLFLITRSGGGGIKSAEGTVLMKCRNPECEADYQKDKEEYYMFIQMNIDPMATEMPPVVCEQCGEESAYLAMECPNCEVIFEMGAIPDEFPDKCPACGHSDTETLQKPSRKRRKR